jgi:hypothetical protein
VTFLSLRDSLGRLSFLGGIALLMVGACAAQLQPIVESRPIAPRDTSLKKVVVAPFAPGPSLGDSLAPGSAGPAETASAVAGFLADALGARGVSTVTPGQFGELPLSADNGAPDPVAAAKLAADRFAATGLLLGTLQRYREREGSARSASSPASVAFEVTFYAAPSGRKLWVARFSETQHSLNERPLDASRYPGGGTRWLTAAELARWGADATVESLAAGS